MPPNDMKILRLLDKPLTYLQRRRLVLLNRVVNNYNINTRAVDEGTNICQYITPDGKKCAIGNELPDSLCRKLEGSIEYIYDKLPEWLKYLDDKQPADIGFLSYIQSLHDNRSYWNEGGLSVQGYNTYLMIIKFYIYEDQETW